ncbi:hypothetical protein D6764_01185 [Candidatus Woesearchaeota archaeon]|nr:MAG: hypothetical protein D6764_01185 [Candidatus Woesearchaeota archaeon]
MKHEPSILAVLIGIFFVSQIVGLAIVDSYLDYETSISSGNETFRTLPFDTPRPDVEQNTSFIWIMFAVIIGTLLVLALIRMRKMRLWRFWFFMSVSLTLTVAFAAFLPQSVALAVALAAAFMKIYRPNFWIHNISEVFMYGGIAAIFVPLINIFSALMLLVLISLYDMYAVWKSKHMITMAQSQTKEQMFAGILIPYFKGRPQKGRKASSGRKVVIKPTVEKKTGSGTVKTAILGGGDVGFPLIFAGVVMKTLLLGGIPVWISRLETLIIVLASTLALFLLMRFGQKGKFYPAMPFLSAGCFLGYVIVFVLNRILFL